MVAEVVNSMPSGGGYTTNTKAARNAISPRWWTSANLHQTKKSRRCVRAPTYLVFLKKLWSVCKKKSNMSLPPSVVRQLAIAGQEDGQGVLGPLECQRSLVSVAYFYELGLGRKLIPNWK